MHTTKSSFADRFHSTAIILLAQQLIKHADQVMHKECHLTYAQFKVLTMLAEHAESTQKQIATCLGLTPAAISRLTESLVQKKLISRHHNPDNRRENKLSITNQGTVILQKALSLLENLEHSLYSQLPKTELTSLKKTLFFLLDKVNQPAA
jgi:DNA-binding MarR family transcriptional regulator